MQSGDAMGFIREEMAEAFAQDDAVRASFEHRKAPQQAERSPAMVFKTHEPQMQQNAGAAMDAEKTADWNRWFESSFKNAFKRWIVPAVGKALASERRLMRSEFNKELALLRGELTILRSVVSGEVKGTDR